MGKLSDIQIPTTEVPITHGQSLTVRGLAVADLVSVVREHSEVLNQLYVEHIAGDKEMPDIDVLAKALLTEAPDVVARIVAAANDEPDKWEVVAKLPSIDQINALVDIAVLTFHSEAEVKKLLATLIQGSESLNRFLGLNDQNLLEADLSQ